MLKDSIYKALDEYSENGKRIPLGSGTAADTENKLIQTLNQCLRRVSLSLPLTEKRAALTFKLTENRICSLLPEDFSSAISLESESGRIISGENYYVNGEYLVCTAFDDGENGFLEYSASAPLFSCDTPADEPVALPDITADALIYLTASELCSPDYSELYSRLMYKYRDIALNGYNAVSSRHGRNTFYSGKRRTRSVFIKR